MFILADADGTLHSYTRPLHARRPISETGVRTWAGRGRRRAIVEPQTRGRAPADSVPVTSLPARLAMLPSTRIWLCATPAALQHLAPWAARSCHKHVRIFWRWRRSSLLEVPEAAEHGQRVSVSECRKTRRQSRVPVRAVDAKAELEHVAVLFTRCKSDRAGKREAARGFGTLMSSLECLNGQSGSCASANASQSEVGVSAFSCAPCIRCTLQKNGRRACVTPRTDAKSRTRFLSCTARAASGGTQSAEWE